MAEQHKESSLADSKEKNSLLDDEIGKEFLGSWKSMSMADDDAMDFSFDTVSKSKKKTFDFEKLDMNFNLDGEFEKISSFKVDMSDLDFTCPPKKSSHSTEKKGEASCAKAGKQDGFNFNFDFNELDSFNLDSSLLKVDTNVDSHQRKKGIATEGNDNEGAKMPKIIDDEGVHASSDKLAMKLETSERVENLEVETSVGNLGNLDSRLDDSVSKISSSENLDMPIKNQISGTSKSTSINQERDLSEKTKSTESKYEQVINKVPSQSVGQSDTEQDTTTEQHTKNFSSGTRVNNASGDKQEVNDEAIFVDSDGVDLQLEHSSSPLAESDGSVREALNLGNNAKEGVINDLKTEQSYTSCGNFTKTDASRKNSCDNIIRENIRSTLECHHLATTNSKPVVDKITLIKDKELQVVQSNISMPDYKSSLRHPSSTAGTKSVSFDLRSITLRRESFKSNDAKFGSKTVSDSLPGSNKPERDAHAPAALLGSKDDLKSCTNARDSFKSSDAKFGSKTVSDSLPVSSKPVRDAHAPTLLGSKDDLKSCSNARDSFKSSDAKFGSKTVSDSLPGSSKPVRNAHAPALLGSKDDLKSCSNARVDTVYDVTPSAGKLAGNMVHEEVNKSKGIILETGTPAKDANILSPEVNPGCFTEKAAKITTLSVKSQPESSGKESIQRSRITSIEGNKLSSFKACKITPAFPSLKISSNIGANSVLATSLHQKEANSLINFERTKEIHGIKASKNDHLTDSGNNQKPLTLFLKRKSIEVSQSDLTSLRSPKRLSQSPCKSRNSKESSEKAVVQVESKPNDFLYNYPTSGPETPSEIEATELEMPDFVLMEDNGNVEKAEAYMKELDNICNMLKKRHEEAKELLVRAVVNDNNLLMLNHPIHEEEISFHSFVGHFLLVI